MAASYPLNRYFAYGIKNSFGIDFDPLTGNLWDTENGPDYGDEINLVEPGFNSGWKKIHGIWYVDGTLAKIGSRPMPQKIWLILLTGERTVLQNLPGTFWCPNSF